MELTISDIKDLILFFVNILYKFEIKNYSIKVST